MPPVDTDLTPTAFNPGSSGSNPLGAISTITGIQSQILQQQLLRNKNALFPLEQQQLQNSLKTQQLEQQNLSNQNTQFQQVFTAKQLYGSIAAKHPNDPDGAFAEASQNPVIAPFIPDIMNSNLEAAKNLTALQGARMTNQDSAATLGLKLMAGGLNNPALLPSLRDTALKLAPDKKSGEVINNLYTAITSGINPNETDPAKITANKKTLYSNSINLMTGMGGIPSDTINTNTGNLPSIRTAGPGGGIMQLPATGVENAPGTVPGASLSPPPSVSPPPLAGNGKPLIVSPETLPKTPLGQNNQPIYPSSSYAEGVHALQQEFIKQQPAYDAAAQSMADLNTTQSDIKSIASHSDGTLDGLVHMGAGGSISLGLANAINSLNHIIDPSAPPKIDPSKIAAGESINKNQIQLGFNLAKTFGPGREPLGIVENALSAVPGINNTPLGGMLVSDLIKARTQWMLDQRTYKQQFSKLSGGDLTGADTQFAQDYRPETYVQPVLDKYGLGPKGFNTFQDLGKQYTDGLINGKMMYDQALKQGFVTKKGYDAAEVRNFTPPGGQ